METIIPPRLKEGDHVRVIAPSWPLSNIDPGIQKKAHEHLSENLGLEVSFGNVEDMSIENRYQDLVDAFEDDTVSIVMPTYGGFNSNEILTYCYYNPALGERLWRVVRDNPKIFMGASDNSMINNALFSQTGLISYYGYNYTTIGMSTARTDVEYMMRQLTSGLTGKSDRYPLVRSKSWEDEVWNLGNVTTYRRFNNEGPRLLEKPDDIVNVIGRIAVGCVRNLSIMASTSYQPQFDGYIRRIKADDEHEEPEDVVLFLEDTMALSAEGLQRELSSLTMSPGWERVKAIIIGRIPHDHKGAFGERKLKRLGEADEGGPENLKNILLSLKHLNALANVAIVATGFDLGHTKPTVMVPVGGWARVTAFPDGLIDVEVSHTPYIGRKNEIVKRMIRE